MANHGAVLFIALVPLFFLANFVSANEEKCKEGWYGTDCKSPCYCAQRNACNQTDGVCPTVCTTRSCSRDCQTGWYGDSCNKVCHCAGAKPCHHSTGMCPDGCSRGWGGSDCSTGHYGSCEVGWNAHNAFCYHFNSTEVTLEQAADSCQHREAKLLVIDDDAEDAFVNGLASPETESMWLGLCYESYSWYKCPLGTVSRERVRYTKWYDTHGRVYYREYPCAWTTARGQWKFARCNSAKSFMCEKSRPCEAGLYSFGCDTRCHCANGKACYQIDGTCPTVCTNGSCGRDCQTGWYGDSCNKVCHCAGAKPCHHSTGMCPDGCSHGWGGSDCSTENPLPIVKFVCLRTPNDGLRVNLKVDPKKRNFKSFQALSKEGDRLSCNFPSVDFFYIHNNKKFTMTLRLFNAFGDANNDKGSESASITGGSHSADTLQDNRDCLASLTPNKNVTWLVALKEFPDVITDNDITVDVTCDLTKVNSMASVVSLRDASDPGNLVKVNGSSLTTSVYLKDSFTGEQRDTVHLGQSLVMHVDIHGLEDGLICAYPKNCVAKTNSTRDDGMVLLDEDGCAPSTSPVGYLREFGRGSFRSEPFRAFTLSGPGLVLQCQLEVKIRDCERPTCPGGD